MRMSQIVSAGIIALIAAGCGTRHAAPRALTGLSCAAGQRIVIVAHPPEGPYIVRMQRETWWGALGGIGPSPLVFPLLAISVVGKAVTLAIPPVEDLTSEFRKSINATLQGIDLRQLLFSRAEHLKPKPPCEIVYVATSSDKPGEFQPSDKVVVICTYLIFQTDRPIITGHLNATVMTAENAVATERAMLPYFACISKVADFYKRTQCAKLVANLVTPPEIDSMTFDQESPYHSIEEWEAEGGKLVIQEITVLMDRLLAELGQAMFNSP